MSSPPWELGCDRDTLAYLGHQTSPGQAACWLSTLLLRVWLPLQVAYGNRCPAATAFELMGGCLCDQAALAQARGSLWARDPARLPFDDTSAAANFSLTDGF